MSGPLLIIQGYPAAQERIERHWPWYLRAGCPILGVDRLDGRVKWPTEGLIGVRHIGKNSYVNGSNLIELLIGCFEAGLDEDPVVGFPGFESICVIESDGIFLRQLCAPYREHPGGLVATLGGYRNQGFRGSRFYHTPWWCDRITAGYISTFGRRMIETGLIEGGFPDRFLGLMVDLYNIAWTPANAFSVNHINSPQLIEQARHAIKNGAVYVHAVKTAEELATVTEGL